MSECGHFCELWGITDAIPGLLSECCGGRCLLASQGRAKVTGGSSVIQGHLNIPTEDLVCDRGGAEIMSGRVECTVGLVSCFPSGTRCLSTAVLWLAGLNTQREEGLRRGAQPRLTEDGSGPGFLWGSAKGGLWEGGGPCRAVSRRYRAPRPRTPCPTLISLWQRDLASALGLQATARQRNHFPRVQPSQTCHYS